MINAVSLQRKSVVVKTTKGGRAAPSKKPEHLPSANGERVAPTIDDALKEKAAKAIKLKSEGPKRGVSSWEEDEEMWRGFRQMHFIARPERLPLSHDNFVVLRSVSGSAKVPRVLPMASLNLLKLSKFARYIL